MALLSSPAPSGDPVIDQGCPAHPRALAALGSGARREQPEESGCICFLRPWPGVGLATPGGGDVLAPLLVCSLPPGALGQGPGGLLLPLSSVARASATSPAQRARTPMACDSSQLAPPLSSSSAWAQNACCTSRKIPVLTMGGSAGGQRGPPGKVPKETRDKAGSPGPAPEESRTAPQVHSRPPKSGALTAHPAEEETEVLAVAGRGQNCQAQAHLSAFNSVHGKKNLRKQYLTAMTYEPLKPTEGTGDCLEPPGVGCPRGLRGRGGDPQGLRLGSSTQEERQGLELWLGPQGPGGTESPVRLKHHSEGRREGDSSVICRGVGGGGDPGVR